MLQLVLIRSTSLLTCTSVNKSAWAHQQWKMCVPISDQFCNVPNGVCHTSKLNKNSLIKIPTQNMSWNILLKIRTLFSHKSPHCRVGWKVWLNKALHRSNLPPSASGYHMKVMLMTSIHFISIQRRNSFIRRKTELIIMISPEIMDFSIYPGHS
jgi:hypothetical protein